jgi:nickel and cobalt resistance protein CnrR
MMSRGGSCFAGLMIVVAVVAATTSYITTHALSARSEVDIHQQIHRQLGLSEEQERLLKPIEERFKARRQELRATLDQANLELAKAIREDKSDSNRARDAVNRIHEAMGELQVATLQHVFERKTMLTSEQYDRLIQLTASALERIDDNS